MRTLKITLSYDGTDFVGWQRQANGRSVQAVLEDALSEIDKRGVAVVGAGRTDSGVHALGQVASAQIEHAIPAAPLRQALNTTLPADVRIVTVEEVPASFNARSAARSKIYRYRIFNGETISPFARRYAWHVPYALDLSLMKAAGQELIGQHDFTAFQAAGSGATRTVRTITVSEWSDASAEAGAPNAGPTRGSRAWAPNAAAALGWPYGAPSEIPGDNGLMLTYHVAGAGFLRYMVRNIVGTLVEVGSGRRAAGSLGLLLASMDRGLAGPTAPPHGLYLVQVDYDTAGADFEREQPKIEDEEDGRDILQ
jgi:tRNA pseudouridine38-40 synthase